MSFSLPRKTVVGSALAWLGIVAVTMGMFGFSFRSYPPFPLGASDLAHLKARMQTMVSLDAAESYRFEFGKLPANAHELAVGLSLVHPLKGEHRDWLDTKAGDEVDPWGTPLRIEGSATSFSITSAGPDRKFGTADDLTTSNDPTKE